MLDLNEDAKATPEILQVSFDEHAIVEDSINRVMDAPKDRDHEGDAEDEDSDNGFDPTNYVNDGWTTSPDDYWSRDDSGTESNN